MRSNSKMRLRMPIKIIVKKRQKKSIKYYIFSYYHTQIFFK